MKNKDKFYHPELEVVNGHRPECVDYSKEGMFTGAAMRMLEREHYYTARGKISVTPEQWAIQSNDGDLLYDNEEEYLSDMALLRRMELLETTPLDREVFYAIKKIGSTRCKIDMIEFETGNLIISSSECMFDISETRVNGHDWMWYDCYIGAPYKEEGNTSEKLQQAIAAKSLNILVGNKKGAEVILRGVRIAEKENVDRRNPNYDSIQYILHGIVLLSDEFKEKGIEVLFNKGG